MVINYQDPLKEPYVKPSNRRFLRGTLAHRNVLALTAGFTAFSLSSGLVMYFCFTEETQQRYRDKIKKYHDWRGERPPLMMMGSDAREPGKPGKETIKEKVEDLFVPDQWKFWKASFFLDPFREAYEDAKPVTEEVDKLGERRE